MKCKRCKREIQKEFNVCPWCGLRLIPDATEIKVPEPKRKADGSFSQQVMFNGKRYTVSGATLEEYKANAREIKRGHIPDPEPKSDTFFAVATAYIEANREQWSPRTVANYIKYRDKVLVDINQSSVLDIDWNNVMLNLEKKKYSGVYIRSVFMFIISSLKFSNYHVQIRRLPKISKRNTFLDDKQIKILLEHIRGHKAEAGIILCLHSLRKSEALAITAEDIHDGFIWVNKQYSPDEYGVYNVENRTKTEKSNRKIPVFIDRLYEVIPPHGRVVPYAPNYFAELVGKLCVEAGLPHCSPHDLRRSFASLAVSLGVPDRRIMEYGGWSSPEIMNEVYVKLYDRTSKTDAQPLMDYFNSTANNGKTQAE